MRVVETKGLWRSATAFAIVERTVAVCDSLERSQIQKQSRQELGQVVALIADLNGVDQLNRGVRPTASMGNTAVMQVLMLRYFVHEGLGGPELGQYLQDLIRSLSLLYRRGQLDERRRYELLRWLARMEAYFPPEFEI